MGFLDGFERQRRKILAPHPIQNLNGDYAAIGGAKRLATKRLCKVITKNLYGYFECIEREVMASSLRKG